MDVTITLNEEYCDTITIKAVNLGHLIDILRFQHNEKGKTISGYILIDNPENNEHESNEQRNASIA